MSPSFHSRMNEALEFNRGTLGRLNAAIPATRTDVSTTPLGCFLFFCGNDGDP
jgi:hypothetical protein